MEPNGIINTNIEKETSVKSIDEKDNNKDIIDIIEYNNNNFIIFKSRNSCPINVKSITKIFSFLYEKEKLSDIYLDYITINVFDYNLNINNESEDQKDSNNCKNEKIELDVKHKMVLDKASLFYINLENNLISKDNSNTNKKMKLIRKSLIKIFNYLNNSIIGMSDYINLVILYLEEENHNDLAKFLIEQKILGKYSGEPRKIIFNGKKDYNCNIGIPLKNESQNIYTLDNLFNKVLDYIDDCDKESSFSDNINNLIIPRKNIDDDLIQTEKVYFVEEGILTEFDSSKFNNNKKKDNNGNNQNLNQKNCNIEFCKEMCNIF